MNFKIDINLNIIVGLIFCGWCLTQPGYLGLIGAVGIIYLLK